MREMRATAQRAKNDGPDFDSAHFCLYLVPLGCWEYTPAVVAANGRKPYLRSFSGFSVSMLGTSWSVMTAGDAIRNL